MLLDTDCTSATLPELNTLPFTVNCYIDQTCTAVKCCQEISQLSTTMETEVTIDPCDFMLTVRIEKLQFKVTLFDYEWGKYYSLSFLTTHYKLFYIFFLK